MESMGITKKQVISEKSKDVQSGKLSRLESNVNNMYKCEKFKKWKFGTINIRSGKERDLGAKLYCIAKEVSQAGLSFCCLQEVKYLNNNSKVITLDTGEKFEFHWCGRKKRREAGVGILIKVDSQIEISDPDIQDARVMAMNIRIYGFSLRILNVYSPTDIG